MSKNLGSEKKWPKIWSMEFFTLNVIKILCTSWNSVWSPVGYLKMSHWNDSNEQYVNKASETSN